MRNRKLSSKFSAVLALFIITTLLALAASTSTAHARSFLVRKPYNGIVRLNSLFDHDVPSQADTDDELVTFLDITLTGADVYTTCLLGYNCYDGHSGLDYRTSYNPIYAPARGKVFYDTVSTSYGTQLFLEHDLDGDGTPEYLTHYAHLQAGSIPTDLDEVGAGDFIGDSGNTGTGSDGAHLHFAVRKYDPNASDPSDPFDHPLMDPYGWWSNSADPAAGREGVGNHGSTDSEWLWGDGLPQHLVDDEDVSFQQFQTSMAWQEVTDSNAYAGRALWSQGMHNPTRQWDNWAFWVGNITRTGEYDVKVYIPDYDTGHDVSTEAWYTVYYQAENGSFVTDDVIVDQSAHVGEWFTLGRYHLKYGPRAAVRLVDEVSSSSNHLKAIWADAVRWDAVDEGNDPNCLCFADVLPSSWYYYYVSSLTCRGVVQGYPDGLYRPDNDVNRVEFLKMAVEGSGRHCCTDCNGCDNCISCPLGFPAPYIDINPFAWYMPYLNAAYWGGWIPDEGFGFEPEGAAKRMWVAQVLVYASGGHIDTCVDDGTSPFEDISPSAKCHQDNIFAWRANELGVFDGHAERDCDGNSASGNHFCGDNTLNRAEAAKVVECAFFKDTAQK